MGAAAFLAVAGIGPVAAEAGAATPASLPHSMGQLRQLLTEKGLDVNPEAAGPSVVGPKVVTPSQWTNVPTPTFGAGQTQVLDSVSCATPTGCMAVGIMDTTTGAQPIAATFSGGRWTAVPVPAPSGEPDSGLVSVSCPTGNFCVAVGVQSAATTTTIGGVTPETAPTTATSLIEQWDGHTWTIVPSPTSGKVDLAGVSCANATSCVAVGTTLTTTAETAVTVIDRWNGSNWTTSQVAPAATTVRLTTGVSCATATFCMVTGAQLSPTASTTVFTGLTAKLFTLKWDGTNWTTVPTPAPPMATLQIGYAVSCADPSLCMAVGYQVTYTTTVTASTVEGVIEQWNGSSWTATPTPGPATYVELRAVDCFGPTSCVATGLGVTDTPAPAGLPLVENWNGTAWSQAALPPVPANTTLTDQPLLGVSCVAGAQCVTVGENPPGTFSLVAPVTRSGYGEVASDGGIFAFGTPFYGSMGGKPLNQPIVGMAMTPDGGGYWEVASDGGIFAFGDAQFYGSIGGHPLNQPVVGIAATPDGQGYWEVASDGGIFAFGDAQFYGSMGGKALNKPVVGIAATPGGGYYEVAGDGGLFAFGDAPFLGSMGGQPLNQPVVGMAVTPAGGYYEVAGDGGLFAYTAPFLGSMGDRSLNEPVVGMTVDPSGGYYEVASDGGLFAFGAPFLGSMGGQALNTPIVGMAQ